MRLSVAIAKKKTMLGNGYNYINRGLQQETLPFNFHMQTNYNFSPMELKCFASQIVDSKVDVTLSRSLYTKYEMSASCNYSVVNLTHLQEHGTFSAFQHNYIFM